MPAFPIPYEPSIHEKKFIEHFGIAGLRLNRKRLHEGLRTYVICFTNRCGSNLLGELISTNTSFGIAGEYLNAPGVIKICTEKNFKTLQQYLWWLAKRKASSEGILGIKLSYRQLFFLAANDLMPLVFGDVRFIHMQRSDVLRQAVSHVIATQTKAWSSQQISQLNASDIAFKGNQIVRIMDSIYAANAKFHCFFSVYGIQPVRVTYEDLVQDLQTTGDRVIRDLGFPGIKAVSVLPRAVTLKRQSSNLNEVFAKRVHDRYDRFRSRVTE